MLFAKKKAVRNITKLYFFTDEEKDFDLPWVREHALRYCSGLPSKFSVNFGGNKDISKLPKRMRPSELEYLDVTSSEGGAMLVLSQAFVKPDKRLIHECTIISEFDHTFFHEKELITWFDGYFELIYGYSRALREDYHPTSETKIKKGVFSTELRAEKLSVWMSSPYEMSAGGVKGIYPVNYWTEGALKKMEEIGFDVSHVGSGNIFHFSDVEGESMRRNNPKYKDFVRFDEFGT